MSELRRVAQQTVPPIGLQKVLPSVGAQTIRSRLAPRGRLQAARDGWKIHVPYDTPWRVGRFTVAHELAHILLFDAVSADRGLIAELRTSQKLWRPVEDLCDRGAAELLVPSNDLEQMLDRALPESKGEALRLYDRYMVSPAVFMRRICDLSDDRSYTAWDYSPHGSKPADWRVSGVYTKLRTGRYIPNHLSAKNRLAPNVIEAAAQTGFAFAEMATLTTGGQRHTGRMCALNPAVRDNETPLPSFEGSVIHDSHGGTVHLLIDHQSVGPISRRTRFG